jgi:hypothetical protein
MKINCVRWPIAKAVIGVNPYVYLPEDILAKVHQNAGRDKGPIPVKGKLNGEPYIQTLVKYAGAWRLYLNTPMRESTNTKVGDTVTIEIAHDPSPRIVPIPSLFAQELEKSIEAKEAFNKLHPSHQKEFLRYLGGLKSEEALQRNIEKTINYLEGKKVEGVLFRK